MYMWTVIDSSFKLVHYALLYYNYRYAQNNIVRNLFSEYFKILSMNMMKAKNVHVL